MQEQGFLSILLNEDIPLLLKLFLFKLPLLMLVGLIITFVNSLLKKTRQGIFPLSPISMFVTCFGIGNIPVSPGTCGTIFALALVTEFLFLPHYGVFEPALLLPILIILTIFITIFGIFACNIYCKKTKTEDAKEVVIDEVAGFFVAVVIVGLFYFVLLKIEGFAIEGAGETATQVTSTSQESNRFSRYLPLSPIFILVIFVLFRIFDIAKPWHIGWCDKNIKGGLGIMLDDVVAGIHTGLVFILLYLLCYAMGVLDFLLARAFSGF